MSKQSEAKEAQGYTTQQRNCGSCAHMRFEMRTPAWIRAQVADGIKSQAYADRHAEEAGHKCAIGGFAIQKTARCDRFEGKA